MSEMDEFRKEMKDNVLGDGVSTAVSMYSLESVEEFTPGFIEIRN